MSNTVSKEFFLTEIKRITELINDRFKTLSDQIKDLERRVEEVERKPITL